MHRLVAPLLHLGGELVLVVLQTHEQVVAVVAVDVRVVQLHPGFLDVCHHAVVLAASAAEAERLVAAGQHRDVGEHGAHHGGRGRVDRSLVAVGVPRQDDHRQLVEPGAGPQVVHVLGQRLAVALPTVVEEQLLVVPLERDPRGRVALHAGGSDVERDVHGVRRVEVEVLSSLVCVQLGQRLAVHRCSVHLLERAVVLLLEHTVVAEATLVRVSDGLQLRLGEHRLQPVADHDGVDVVDGADDALVVVTPLQALHELPQRVVPLATRSARHHELLVLRVVREDRHEAGHGVFLGEQRQLREGVVLERRAHAVLVLTALEVPLQLEAALVGEGPHHLGASPGHLVGGDVVLQHTDVLSVVRIEVRLVPQDVTDHGVVEGDVDARGLRDSQPPLAHLHAHGGVLPRLPGEDGHAVPLGAPHAVELRLVRTWPVEDGEGGHQNRSPPSPSVENSAEKSSAPSPLFPAFAGMPACGT